MKPMTKATPLTLAGLLIGSVVFMMLFTLSESVQGMIFNLVAGIIVLVCGLLFGVFGLFRSVIVLSSAESRRVSGVEPPIVTIIVTLAAWSIVILAVSAVYNAMQVYRQGTQRRACMINLRQVGCKMRTYALASIPTAP